MIIPYDPLVSLSEYLFWIWLYDADEGGGDGRYPIAILISVSEFSRDSSSWVSIHETIWLTLNWPAATIIYRLWVTL